MATLGRTVVSLTRQRSLLLSARSFSSSICLNGHYPDKYWKPGPIPTTPEERAAAAKKYGLRPEDYKVNPDKDMGDYPDLPAVSPEFRSPWEDYDYGPIEKRNFGEPFYHDFEALGSFSKDPRHEIPRGYTVFGIFWRIALAISLILGFLYWDILYRPRFVPEMPKQYPFDIEGKNQGLPSPTKHYTFEPADSS